MKRFSGVFLVLFALASQSYAASVPLVWDYVDEPLNPAVSFMMYRDVNCTGVFTPLASINKPAVRYTDTTASPGTTYCYKVTAKNAVGGESSASNTLQFSVPIPPVNSPSNLRVE
jgi:fibronectin type 3 domain-containing protein